MSIFNNVSYNNTINGSVTLPTYNSGIYASNHSSNSVSTATITSTNLSIGDVLIKATNDNNNPKVEINAKLLLKNVDVLDVLQQLLTVNNLILRNYDYEEKYPNLKKLGLEYSKSLDDFKNNNNNKSYLTAGKKYQKLEEKLRIIETIKGNENNDYG